jgi:hypothetical protein
MPVLSRALAVDVNSPSFQRLSTEEKYRLLLDERCVLEDRLRLYEEHKEDETQPSDLSVALVLDRVNRQNVKDCCDTVMRAFRSGKKIVTLFGHMQAGKTRALCEVGREYANEHAHQGEGFQDSFQRSVIFISGYSSVGLKNESIKKILDEFEQEGISSSEIKYYHRNDLNKNSVKEICRLAQLNNALIIIDEAHIACEEGMTMDELLESTGILDRDNDVKVLAVSATPSACLQDCHAYLDHELVCLRPGEGYVGVKKLLELGCVREAKDLSTDESASVELVNEIMERWGMRAPKVHMLRVRFRAPSEKQQRKAEREGTVLQMTCQFEEYLRRALGGHGFTRANYTIIHHDQWNRMHNVDAMLESGVNKHTFVMIKEFYRCGRSLSKKHLGVFYENRVSKPDCNTVAQGGLGRLCGYWSYSDNRSLPMVYTSVSGAREWLKNSEKAENLERRDQKIIHTTVMNSRILSVRKDKSIKARPTMFSARSSIHSEEMVREYHVYVKECKKPNGKRSREYKVMSNQRRRTHPSSSSSSHSRPRYDSEYVELPKPIRRVLDYELTGRDDQWEEFLRQFKEDQEEQIVVLPKRSDSARNVSTGVWAPSRYAPKDPFPHIRELKQMYLTQLVLTEYYNELYRIRLVPGSRPGCREFLDKNDQQCTLIYDLFDPDTHELTPEKKVNLGVNGASVGKCLCYVGRKEGSESLFAFVIFEQTHTVQN